MIRETDHDILLAFLIRESMMYRWREDGRQELRRQQFIKRMFDDIIAARPGEGFNYVHINSITNMGLTDSQLVLSAHPWNWEAGDIFCNLPPSPTGRPGFYQSQLLHEGE